jgi:hypothetical protein
MTFFITDMYEERRRKEATNNDYNTKFCLTSMDFLLPGQEIRGAYRLLSIFSSHYVCHFFIDITNDSVFTISFYVLTMNFFQAMMHKSMLCLISKKKGSKQRRASCSRTKDPKVY